MSGVGSFVEIGVQRRAIDRVSARRISAVRPINEPILQIELEIDRFRQTIEQKFDVSTIRRASRLSGCRSSRERGGLCPHRPALFASNKFVRDPDRR